MSSTFIVIGLFVVQDEPELAPFSVLTHCSVCRLPIEECSALINQKAKALADQTLPKGAPGQCECDDDRSRYTCDGQGTSCLGALYADNRVSHANCCAQNGGVWDHRLTLCVNCNSSPRDAATEAPSLDCGPAEVEAFRLIDGLNTGAFVFHDCEPFRLADGSCEACWLATK